MSKFFEKILSLLRVRASAAGLEVSDQVVRLARFDGTAWQMHAIRLEPGVIERGEIKKRDVFIATLAALKTKAVPKDHGKKMNVVVCLSSVEIYTQVFPLPIVQGESLEQAVELNLQMASPLEVAESHSGWQVVGRDENTMRLEILSAFVQKKVVDEMIDALFEAGFLAMALESRALALTRVLREKGAGVDVTKPYLFANIDNSGLDFLIIRNGSLYFEYGTSWKDLTDDKGEISNTKFAATLAASLRQVTNFYNQHWPEPLAAIILSAVALGDEAEKIIAENASLPAVRLTLVMGQPISSEWLVALGCSLRGSSLHSSNNQEISLLGADSQDRFRQEQLLHFMRFWRVVVPVAFAILLLTFGVANAFLTNTKNVIESRSDFQLGGTQTTEIAELEKSAADFNQAEALIAATEAMVIPKNVILQQIAEQASSSHITISHLTFQSFAAPISLAGTAPADTDVVDFKNDLESNPYFSGVNLPLTAVQKTGDIVSFSMTFVASPQPQP